MMIPSSERRTIWISNHFGERWRNCITRNVRQSPFIRLFWIDIWAILELPSKPVDIGHGGYHRANGVSAIRLGFAGDRLQRSGIRKDVLMDRIGVVCRRYWKCSNF